MLVSDFLSFFFFLQQNNYLHFKLATTVWATWICLQCCVVYKWTSGGGEDEWCEAGCWSRWHLWPSTTAVDAGHMLLPQRLLAPFLPHWAHAHVQWPQTHTHTHTHTWNTSSEWIYCTEGYLETTVIQHAFRTCCKIISSHLVFFVYYSDFFFPFFFLSF